MTWKDMIAHARAERDAFKARATFQRKQATELRRKRDWLGVLQAQSREREYRNSAAQRQAFIDENKGKA